ncbi:hypothetical protein [Leisingera thetidis]|uniref:hypothetical protein n=1 Tax=Leisingera thetidis TaxID=2930199 RepID=UPI0021F7C6E8|nr:hypothetical protein [Leisingera thetidis]
MSGISDLAVCRVQDVHRPWADHPLQDAGGAPAIEAWRQHHAQGAGALTRMPQGQPFEPAFLQALQRSLAPLADTRVALIYITVGHQPEYRSPVLPHLLGPLPEFSSVFALRDSPEAIEPVVPALLRSLLQDGQACLLVRDRSRRLIAATAGNRPAGEVRFQIFTPVPRKGADA